jgi:hypothetical protein
MSKFTVKTELSNVIPNKDGTFSYTEDIVSMKISETILPWKSVVDSVVYNPLTGNYTYKEQAESPIYNEFWTPMGQPRKVITDKDKSPRKETKKKKKPKAEWHH